MEEQGFFYRDTWAEVDLDKIVENLKNIKELLPGQPEIIAVVKANAYGHGDCQTAKAALKAGASMLAVAFLDEALALRKKGIQAPILVLGPSRPEYAAIAAAEKISLTVFQSEWIEKAQAVLEEDASLALHLKVDTGMGRIGVKSLKELKEVEELIQGDPRLIFQGVFTHFATADELDEHYFAVQLASFREFLSKLQTLPPLIHCSNSAAALRYPDAHFSAVRIGISMYGLSPSPEMANLLPVHLQEAFSLHSRVVHVKKLLKGEKVSYGATYEASEEEWVGTLPIGYADGWIRRLQGQEVLVDGIRSPIIGRVCMDQCMVKLPYEVPVGTAATLIGTQGQEKVGIDEIAEKLETINYEVPCLISYRVPRLYRKNGETIGVNNPILK
ncbi:alanine racemase [Mesobacillus zeae]|uniref:Alanine racemase n=1 Tax=Mesobacillus zeae TaxID=1917180 RepID=A0A398B604_9BACI|nr:alanine racemase [Mesobacillus zeae]RID84238.1 alanine racemase [Mesobacillus zeae]